MFIAQTFPWTVFAWVFPVYLIALALAYRWIFRSDQDCVTPGLQSGALTAIRLGIVMALGSAILTDFLQLTPRAAAGILLFLVLWSTQANIQIPPGDGYIDIILWSLLVMPLYLIKEFVFGFPVQKDLFLKPEIDPGVQETLQHLVGQTAIVAGPLRPSGTVTVEGQTLTAQSESRDFIESGTSVLIVRCNHTTLVVRPATSDRKTS